MILDNEEAEARLTNPNNLWLRIRENKEKNALDPTPTTKNTVVEILPYPIGGRRPGDRAIPDKIKELIGSLAVQGNETQKEIASVFGVSQVTVSDVSRGLVGDRLDSTLAEAIDLNKDTNKDKKENTAHNLALDALVGSLGIVSNKLTEEKETLSLKAVTSLATNMSRIVQNLKSKDAPSAVSNVKVVLFQPQLKQENHYDTTEV
jgi:hypothetical protein